MECFGFISGQRPVEETYFIHAAGHGRMSPGGPAEGEDAVAGLRFDIGIVGAHQGAIEIEILLPSGAIPTPDQVVPFSGFNRKRRIPCAIVASVALAHSGNDSLIFVDLTYRLLRASERQSNKQFHLP